MCLKKSVIAKVPVSRLIGVNVFRELYFLFLMASSIMFFDTKFLEFIKCAQPLKKHLYLYFLILNVF